MSNAYLEILAFLRPKEKIEAIVFGSDYRVSSTTIPKEIKYKAISIKEAIPYLENWSTTAEGLDPEIIPFIVWTNERILFLSFAFSLEGSSVFIEDLPRNPLDCDPGLIGEC